MKNESTLFVGTIRDETPVPPAKPTLLRIKSSREPHPSPAYNPFEFYTQIVWARYSLCKKSSD